MTVADDGGSSGQLRRDLGLLPPGDLRKAMLALADPTAEIRELFGYRFERGDLAGHNLGSLAWPPSPTSREGSRRRWRRRPAGCGSRAGVLPATLVPVRLCGRVDGRAVEEQVAIGAASGGSSQSGWSRSRPAAVVPAAVRAVRQADLVLLGPGSTFTSVVPNLLVPELADALTDASRLVYICNLEAQPGETTGFPLATLAAILDHCPACRWRPVLCQRPPGRRRRRPGSCGPSPSSGRRSSTPRWPPTTTPAATTPPAWPPPSRSWRRERMSSRGEFTVRVKELAALRFGRPRRAPRPAGRPAPLRRHPPHRQHPGPPLRLVLATGSGRVTRLAFWLLHTATASGPTSEVREAGALARGPATGRYRPTGSSGC